MQQHAAERIARGHHPERVIADDLPERPVYRAVQEANPVPAEVLADDTELTPVTGSGAWLTVTPDLLASEISERSARAMLQQA